MTRRKARHRPLMRTWLAPVAIAGVTLVGLVAGLLGDGVNDVAAAVGLAVPVAVLTWALWFGR